MFSSSSSSSSAGGSHGLVFLSTAIFISTTLLFLAFPRQRSTPRSCLTSYDGKKKERKKMKRVRFADDVKINIIRIEGVDQFKKKKHVKRSRNQQKTRIFAFSSSPPDSDNSYDSYPALSCRQ